MKLAENWSLISNSCDKCSKNAACCCATDNLSSIRLNPAESSAVIFFVVGDEILELSMHVHSLHNYVHIIFLPYHIIY